ncbi:MAG: glycosyltransferase [Bacteroidaceae bacterium]|nr:glycosyltransferase [Bacteroidaceae bacterium]
MNDKPLITIITVTYNAEPTIEQTLESVERQTYPRIEHLIVDGCSTDHTMSHVQRYVERNAEPNRHTIRVVREPDNGLYDAMNKGINLAAGDYLVFLNAGDRLHEPTTIEQIVSQTGWQRDRANYAVLYGETDLVDAEGHFLRHRRLEAPERLSSKSFLQGMLVCHQSFYARTDLARSEPFDLRYRYSADYDWCIRLMRRAERRRLRFLNTHLILTDYLSEGLTTRNHRRSLLERLRLMAHHYGWSRAILAHLWFVVRAIIKR